MRCLSSLAFISISSLLCHTTLSGCSEAARQTNQSQFFVKVTVAGLSGSGLLLQNNGVDDLVVASDGIHTFRISLLPTTQYAVTVAQQPVHLAQTCSVEHASGQIPNTNVEDVLVRCIDDIAPKVIQIDPPANALNVDTSSVITITFDDPITTLEPGWIVIRNASGDTVSGIFDSPAPNQIRFISTTTMLLASTYSIALATTIKDPAGNALADPIAQLFSTRDGKWGNILYTPSADSVSKPTGHALDNGDFNWVWTTSSIGIVSLHAQSYVRKTKSWSTVSSAPQPDTASKVVSRSTGNLTVVELLPYFDSLPLRALDLINGIWASAATDISNTSLPLSGNNTKGFRSVASNANGNLSVVWLQSGIANYEVRGNIHGKDGWNSEAYNISGSLLDSTVPATALDNKDNALVFWQEGDGSMSAKYHTPETGWGNGKWQMGKALFFNASAKALEFDHFGNALAAWIYDKNGSYEIGANDYRSGTPGAWGSADGVSITTSSTQKPANLSLSFDPSGNGTLLWEKPESFNVSYRSLMASYFSATSKTWSATPRNLGIYDAEYRTVELSTGEIIVVLGNFNALSNQLSAVKLVNGTWSNTTVLTQPLPIGYQIGPATLFNNSFELLAAWSLHDSISGANGGSVWLNLYSGNSWYADPKKVKSPTSDKVVPGSVRAVLDKNGKALVTWSVEISTSSFDLYAARCEQGVCLSEQKLNVENLSVLHTDLYIDLLGEVTAVWTEGGKLALRRFE